jgi:DNA-binding transcriptional LysR family regulator
MHSRIARYFMSIAQHGSIRDAAEALHVAQSALSRTIMNVEQDFGMAMLERHPRGVVLTEAGRIFLRYARDEISQHEHMRDEFDSLKGLRRGTVRIHAVESLARSLLPRLMCAYWERHPDVSFDVKADTSDHITRAVREAETDIGLTYNSPVAADIDVRFQVRQPLVALVSCRHPLAAAKAITMREAAAFPVALISGPSRSRLLIDEACRKERVSLTPVLETNYIELLTSVVERTQTVTFLLTVSAADRIDAGMIVPVPIRNELMNRGSIDVIARASRQLSPAAQDFIGFLGTEFERTREMTSPGPRRGVRRQTCGSRAVRAIHLFCRSSYRTAESPCFRSCLRRVRWLASGERELWYWARIGGLFE